MTITTPEKGFSTKLNDLFLEVRTLTQNGPRQYTIEGGRTATISMPDTADKIVVEYSSKEGEGQSEPFVAGVHLYKRRDQKFGYYEVTVVFGGDTFRLCNNGSHGVAISRGPQNSNRQELKKFFAECKLDTVAIKAAIATRQHPDFSQVVSRTTYEEMRRGIFN